MKRNPVLIEMLLAVLFFALASTVLVQVLFAAYENNAQSRAQTLALVALEDALERCKADGALKEGGEVRYCDENFTPCDEETQNEIRLDIAAQKTQAGALYTVSAAAYFEGELLCALETAVYRGEGAQ